MSHFTAEAKANLFQQHGASAKDTGSIKAQIAMLTERINHISAHNKEHKKDFSSNLGLIKMVGRRKRMLQYLSRTDLAGYRALIAHLGLRK
jgi:small subunit ribosomal protein S15